ncbi:unnamed protein product [Prorocentrum cordatum]|uniref:Uncharacterized protein n=1 Tax=Prorocentrum cordatum TaxID=2364126 RepID=A0ABN9TJJ4_9DINO|nr:unnamed protein product [Polarella glacialis]
MTALIKTAMIRIASSEERCNPTAGWVAEITEPDGHHFATTDKQDSKFMKYASHKLDMLTILTTERSSAVDALMDEAVKAERAVATGPAAVPKRSRREAFGNIPSATQVKVTVRGVEHKVRVATSATHRAKLAIELTSAALSLLLEEPDVAAVPDPDPEIGIEHAEWDRCKRSVKTRYYDVAKQTWRAKSMAVQAGPNMAERAVSMAKVLAAFREQHHTGPGE